MRDKISGYMENANHIVIAYSGGVDSHVLLHAVAHLHDQHTALKIEAVHVNHQLHSQSDHWALHCKEICNALKIPLFIEKIDLHLKPGDSLEEEARHARYTVFKKYIQKDSVLFTAHHLNDQAETFLLQALRGAGPKGLSAMPSKKNCGDGFLIRPLLSFSRDEIESYALLHHLEWINDESNQDPRFRRNFLRHEIFPLLKTYYPAAMKNFARCARLCAGHEAIISDMVQSDFEKIKTEDTAVIDLKKLCQFSDEKQRLLLREWFFRNELRMPNEKHLKQIQKDVINAAVDAHPLFRLGETQIERQGNWLRLTCLSGKCM